MFFKHVFLGFFLIPFLVGSSQAQYRIMLYESEEPNYDVNSIRAQSPLVASDQASLDINEIEVSYNSYIILAVQKDGYTQFSRPYKYMQSITIEVLGARKHKPILRDTIHKVSAPIFETLNIADLYRQKYPKKPLSDLVDAQLIIQITAVDSSKHNFYLRLKHFRVHFVMDFQNPDYPALSLNNFARTGLLESTAKTQVNVSYLMSNADKNAFAVFHVPVFRYESRNKFWRHIELGVSLPVNVLEQDFKLRGAGASIGLLRASNQRTCFQFGVGNLKDETTGEETIGSQSQVLPVLPVADPNESPQGGAFFYVGADIPTFVRFLMENFQ